MLNRIILLVGCIIMLGCNSQQTNGATLITSNELKAVLDKETVQLVDIRTPQEFSAGHIDKAINVNYFSDSFKSDINTLQKDKPVYLYCRSGNRSAKSARILQELGFTKIYDLQGGIIAWNSFNK
ncbi:rhodanese-like domain-containing protein [Tenacibaculum sp. MEBiC06402]|uniref:rhodanese-like domain-containing protein n=1 Tax=unclassified Tenacibaculum TaxID=2635139 RepID=UPI003B9BF747